MIIENNELAILDFSNTNPLQSNLNPDNLLDVSGINDRDGSSISPSISDLDQLTPTNFVDNNLLGDTVESPLGFESLTGGGAINPLDNLHQYIILNQEMHLVFLVFRLHILPDLEKFARIY